ncbi:hypothetical protein BDB01DRAFT_75368 [Pilobolus umbonatus]|nr:hypothetical protein BDB01DRAFT_75368 [Pilobolus umbonatus]
MKFQGFPCYILTSITTRLLQESEMKRWVGMYANKYTHMGNRTSGRAESFHSGLKRALGSQSASRLLLVTQRMHAYYEKKRADRYRKLEVERISIDSLLFDKKQEYRFDEMKFKVVKYAMDRIRFNTIKTLQEDFVYHGSNCYCYDRVNYKLPCPCIIAMNPGVLPLEIVDKRWRFDPSNYEDVADPIDPTEYDGDVNEKNIDQLITANIQSDNSTESLVELEESSEEDEHQEILSLNTSTTGVTSTDSVSVDSHYHETTREKMMNIVKDILQTLYKNISIYKTEQEIANAIKELQDVNSSIKNSMVNVDMLLPPSTNTNRKGRKSKKGVKESTKRLEILREIFEKRQVADVKKKEKDEKVKVETEKKKILGERRKACGSSIEEEKIDIGCSRRRW